MVDKRNNVVYYDEIPNEYSIDCTYSYFRLIATQLVNNAWSLSQFTLHDNLVSYPPPLSTDIQTINSKTYICSTSIPYLFFYNSDTHPVASIMGATNYSNWIDIYLNIPNGYNSIYLGSTVTLVN